MSNRLSKVLSLFLGVRMFMFGFLKFFQPIRGWFDVQIQQSHLPHEAILAGKLTEMVDWGPLLTAMDLEIAGGKKQRSNPADRMFDPLYSDGRGNLCPPAAWRAC